MSSLCVAYIKAFVYFLSVQKSEFSCRELSSTHRNYVYGLSSNFKLQKWNQMRNIFQVVLFNIAVFAVCFTAHTHSSYSVWQAGRFVFSVCIFAFVC